MAILQDNVSFTKCCGGRIFIFKMGTVIPLGYYKLPAAKSCLYLYNTALFIISSSGAGEYEFFPSQFDYFFSSLLPLGKHWFLALISPTRAVADLTVFSLLLKARCSVGEKHNQPPWNNRAALISPSWDLVLPPQHLHICGSWLTTATTLLGRGQRHKKCWPHGFLSVFWLSCTKDLRKFIAAK